MFLNMFNFQVIEENGYDLVATKMVVRELMKCNDEIIVVSQQKCGKIFYIIHLYEKI
jgi:hypothetical protein